MAAAKELYIHLKEVSTVHRPVVISSGDLYKHLGSGSAVVVKDVYKDGSVVWESLSLRDLIEGHCWGKMQGVFFIEHFRRVQEASDLFMEHPARAGLKDGSKPN